MPKAQRIRRREVKDKYRELVERTVEHVGINPKSKNGKRATDEIIFTITELASEIVVKLFGD